MPSALASLTEVVGRGIEVLRVSTQDEDLDRHDDARVRALHSLYVVAEASAAALLGMASDDRLLPAAWPCARTAALAAARALWLGLAEKSDAELRLVALIRETARRCAALADLLDDEAQQGFRQAEQGLYELADQRLAALGEVPKVPGIPTDESLTRGISDEAYALYIMASQFAHGSLMTTALTPGAEAASRVPAERSWAILINLAWLAARNACTVLLNLAGLPVDERIDTVDNDFETALDQLRGGTVD